MPLATFGLSCHTEAKQAAEGHAIGQAGGEGHDFPETQSTISISWLSRMQNRLTFAPIHTPGTAWNAGPT